MATVLDDLIVRLRIDGGQSSRALKNNRDELGRFIAKAKEGKTTLNAFRRAMVEAFTVRSLISGTRGLVGSIVETNKAFQAMRASLKTVTGSADGAERALDRIKKLARETPFSVAEVTKAFIKLKALGLDPSEAAITSYGNTASAMGKSLNDMIEAVADASTGEFERLKEFGIKSRVEGDQVAFTFQGVTTRVGKNAREIEGYLRGIGDTKFAGAMREQMATLGGAFSNLEDAVDQFFVQIGEGGLNDAIIETASAISEMVGESDGLAKVLGRFLGDVLREGLKLFKDLAGRLRDVTREDVAAFFAKVKAAVSAAFEVIRKIVDAIGWLVDKLGGVENAIRVVLPALAALKLGLSGVHTVAFAVGIAISNAFGEDNQQKIEATRRALRQIREEQDNIDKAENEGRAAAIEQAERDAAFMERENRKLTEGFGAGLFTPGTRTKDSVAVDSGSTQTFAEIEKVGEARLGADAEKFQREIDKSVKKASDAARARAKAEGGNVAAAGVGAGSQLRANEIAAREAFSAAIAAGESPAQAQKEGLAVLHKVAKRAGEKELAKGPKDKKEPDKSDAAERIESRIDELVKQRELETFLARRDLLGGEREAAALHAGKTRKKELEEAVKAGRLSTLGGDFSHESKLMRDAGLLGDRSSPPVLVVSIVRAQVDVNAPVTVDASHAGASAEQVGAAVQSAVRKVLGNEVKKAIESIVPPVHR